MSLGYKDGNYPAESQVPVYTSSDVTASAIVCFIIAYCLFGFVAGLVVLTAVLSAGIILILFKQQARR